jgi:arylsulfatase A-like enzyme
MRQEAFIAPEFFDRFEHDDRGTWVEWDRRALDKLVARANAPDQKPLFALAFLMASHFEYQYPPEFEKFVPAQTELRFGTPMSTLGADAAPVLMNRYKNCMGFLDATVTDAIERLDPGKNLVIVTGDHGESIFDDGRFGHGYSFADVVARTPMAIVGPNVPLKSEPGVTEHADLLPTLAHALGGASGPVELAGRDLLANHAQNSGILLAHTAWDGSLADALLVSGELRVRLDLELREPELQLRGFEDELGRPRRYEPTDADIEALRVALATALRGARP